MAPKFSGLKSDRGSMKDPQKKARLLKPRNKMDLVRGLHLEWGNIVQDTCRDLVDSMPHRVREVLLAKVETTKW